MKIAHVIASIDPSQGGPSNSVPSLAASMAALGVDSVVVFNSTPSRGLSVKHALESLPYFDKLRLLDIPRNSVRQILPTSKSENAVVKTICDCDLVHIHGMWDPIVVNAAVNCLRLKKHYVVSPRGMVNPWSLMQKRVRKQVMLKVFSKRVLRDSSFVHALNGIEANAIEALCRECSVKVFPNGVFPEQYKSLAAPNALCRRLPNLYGRRYILFLGRLHYVKGLDFMADAFAVVAKVIQDIDLVVVGPEDGAKEDFLKRIAGHSIRNRVHIVGPIYGAEKYGIMKDALCFLQPSRQEGFSMAVTEAMACGVPVVISKNCNFPEVERVGAGAVVPLDSAAISSALIRIITNPDQRQKMAKAARGLVFGKYTWPQIAVRMMQAYEEAISVPRL